MGKRVGLWLVFLLLMVVVYAVRGDLVRVAKQTLAAVVPGLGFVDRPGSMRFYRANDGHFHIEARVNGQWVRFMVDTGASDVMLTPEAARSLGFHPESLEFSKTYNTANGQVKGAPILLQRFQVGELLLENLPASVNGAAMRHSLLGMRFFNRLAGFQVQKEVLTIQWQEERVGAKGGS